MLVKKKLGRGNIHLFTNPLEQALRDMPFFTHHHPQLPGSTNIGLLFPNPPPKP